MTRYLLVGALVFGLAAATVTAPPGKRRFPGKLSPQTQQQMRTKELIEIMKHRDPFNRARSLWWYQFNGRDRGRTVR